MAQFTYCPNCGKEIVAVRFYCGTCEKEYCADCANNHPHPKKSTVWEVTFKSDQGEQIGPVIAKISKTKPTAWAKKAYNGAYTFDMVNTGKTEDEYEEALTA
jgi:hypothetical protein